MKKFTAILMAAILTSTMLCACSSGSGTISPADDKFDSQASESSVSENETVSEDNVSENESSISPLTSVAGETDSKDENVSESGNAKADILSFEVEIDGTSFTLPFDYSEIEKIGYVIRDDDDALNANTYTIGTYIKKDDESVSVQFWNPTDEKKKYSECLIGQVEFDASNAAEVVLPGGLVFDESITPEKIIEFYGEPDSMNEGDGYIHIQYKKDIYSSVSFFLHPDEKLKPYSTVTIQNLI